MFVQQIHQETFFCIMALIWHYEVRLVLQGLTRPMSYERMVCVISKLTV